MEGLRTLKIRIDALLLLVVAGLILGVALAWDYHGRRPAPASERERFAAELLAYGLPQEAAAVLEEVVLIDPEAARNLRLRRVLADVLMDRLGDYEKALSHLVFVRSTDPGQASATESGIRRCMERLGRVYDIQRRLLLEDGKNPIVNRVSSDTAIRLGNEPVASVDEVRQRLAQLGLPVKNPPKEALAQVTQGMASEILLRRAAKRAGIARQPAFLDQVRQFEENLALQKYLEQTVLKDVKVDDQALALYLQQHQAEFDSPLRVVYSGFAFPDEAAAMSFVGGTAPATPPVVIWDHENALAKDLPQPLRSIKWETEPVKGNLGPVEFQGRWMVFPIHEVIAPRRVAPDLARQQARLKLLEEKQSGKLAEAIAELAQREELKVNDDVLQRALYPDQASGSTQLPAPRPETEPGK